MFCNSHCSRCNFKKDTSELHTWKYLRWHKPVIHFWCLADQGRHYQTKCLSSWNDICWGCWRASRKLLLVMMQAGIEPVNILYPYQYLKGGALWAICLGVRTFSIQYSLLLYVRCSDVADTVCIRVSAETCALKYQSSSIQSSDVSAHVRITHPFTSMQGPPLCKSEDGLLNLWKIIIKIRWYG